MEFLKFLRILRYGIRFLALFVLAGIFAITGIAVAILHFTIEILYRFQYGSDWAKSYEAKFGVGSLVEDQKMALIGGFASLAIILVMFWGYKNTFGKNKILKTPRHRRRHF